MAGSSGNFAFHKANNDVNMANRYRTCELKAKQNLNFSENNLETGLMHILNCKGNKSEDENRKSEVCDKETNENSTTDSTLRPNHKYMSKSGDPKMSRGILKNVHNNDVNRPTTIESSREIDTIVVPRWSSMENQKYRLKINGFVNLDDSDTGKGSRETHLPEVNVDMTEDNVYKGLKGTKHALREKIFEAGDTFTYFNTAKMHQRSETESPFSFDVGHVGISPSLSRSRSLDSVEDGVYRDPWEDTLERKSISISDSEECDTDLEIDKDFGKGSPRKNVPPYLPDIIPLSDMNIGKTLYTRECKKWQIAPQKHVLHSLQERSMTLRNRSLGARAIPPLSAALKDNLRVERLNLDGVDITDDGIQHLAEMLIDNITITHLNVANNNLGIRGAQVLGHVLVVTQNITNLNLSGNKLDENSSWYLTSGIGSNTSITHLDLSYNELGEQAGVLMGSALAHNNTLCNLNMCWNKVCGKGAVAIFRALMLNSTLEVLNISWNGLGYDGTVALSKCLKRNGGLRDLDVSNNRLNWRCAFLLAEGLRGNTTLAKLRIGHNPLTTTGVMDMLEAVATAESAITLLDCAEIPVLGAADLLSATISRRRTFNFMHGGIVPTHDKFGQRLGRELNPMLRIIEYLRLLGLRPLELMKSFDKTSTSFELPRKDFIDQIKKIGVKLHSYEIDALANSISGKGYNKNVINYRKLSLAVREVVEAERERKIKEREEWLQIKTYHESILKKGTLDEYISHSGSVRDPLDPLKVKSFQTIGRSGTSRNSTVSKPGSVDSSKFKIGHNPLTTTGVMDMLEAVATAESAITLLDCTEIPVLGAADLLSATISRRRTFNFMHGGIVPTHDKFGQRLGRELNPMLRIIEYLRLLGLRPLELMKSFDKTSSSFELPRKDFIDQIKKIGVKLHSYEIDALANSISGKGYNKNVINYRKLSLAVREVVEAERERKIKEREEWLQIKTYHESILKKGTLDEYISHSGSVRDPLDPLKVKSFQTIGRSGTSRNSTVSKPGSVDSSKFKIGHNPLTTTGVMDMLEAVATAESAITLLDCTEIPVLGAADLLSATISRRRTFNFMHGGIVPTHDKFGQRLGRELNPMLRIIEYLRLLGLRPLELMKSFDKTSSSFELPRKDFIDQIKKIGVKLHSYEIDALANSISGKGYNKNVINYRKLSLAVREVVEAERERKIKEREEWLQIKTYHESILKKGTLDEYISHSGSVRDPLDPLKVKSFQTIGRSGTSRNSTVSKPGSVDSSKFKVSLFSPIVISRSSFRPVKQKSKKKETKKRHI